MHVSQYESLSAQGLAIAPKLKKAIIAKNEAEVVRSADEFAAIAICMLDGGVPLGELVPFVERFGQLAGLDLLDFDLPREIFGTPEAN
jgi:hypothetical protein